MQERPSDVPERTDREQWLSEMMLPQDLWDRPLLANLLAQFIKARDGTIKDNQVTELKIFQGVLNDLIAEVAKKTSKPEQDLTEALEALCLRKLEKGNRMITRSELNDEEVWEEARRGHLCPFEPLRGGDAVQLAHLRFSDVLAAEKWYKEGAAVSSPHKIWNYFETN